jgi:hypothetical protein
VCASKSISSLPGIVINECIELFFQWQRPFSTIVDRDALRSNCPSGSTEQTSSGLLYAVCALGSLMSHDHNIKDLAPSFASAAENLLWDSFYPSHLSTMQAFLLCAVFESGRGNMSKAWMYSGSASVKPTQININVCRDRASHGRRPWCPRGSPTTCFNRLFRYTVRGLRVTAAYVSDLIYIR